MKKIILISLIVSMLILSVVLVACSGPLAGEGTATGRRTTSPSAPPTIQCKDNDENSKAKGSPGGNEFSEFLFEGKVVSDIYKTGKADYCAVIDGKTYLMEGTCNNNAYQAIQKNCGEIENYLKEKCLQNNYFKSTKSTYVCMGLLKEGLECRHGACALKTCKIPRQINGEEQQCLIKLEETINQDKEKKKKLSAFCDTEAFATMEPYKSCFFPHEEVTLGYLFGMCLSKNFPEFAPQVNACLGGDMPPLPVGSPDTYTESCGKVICEAKFKMESGGIIKTEMVVSKEECKVGTILTSDYYTISITEVISMSAPLTVPGCKG